VLILNMIEILPPLGKYKYDIWRILPVKCYIGNSVCLRSCIKNVNNAFQFGSHKNKIFVPYRHLAKLGITLKQTPTQLHRAHVVMSNAAGVLVPLALMRGTTVHSHTEHRSVNFLQHHQKLKTLSLNQKLRRDSWTTKGSFSTNQIHKLNTISSIQRVAHRPKSRSPTRSARSRSTRSEAQNQSHCARCIISI
jgi:hypothetical protein